MAHRQAQGAWAYSKARRELQPRWRKGFGTRHLLVSYGFFTPRVGPTMLARATKVNCVILSLHDRRRRRTQQKLGFSDNKPCNVQNLPGQRLSAGLAVVLVLLATLVMSTPVYAAPLRILAFGDSLTYGIGGSGKGYPEWLGFFTGHEVINAGSPGDTTADGVQALPAALRRSQPDLLILCLGWNDFLRQLPAADVEKNLASMLAIAEGQSVAVLLLALPRPGASTASPIFARWANSPNVTLETELMVEVLNSAQLKSDLAHPNQEGYKQIATRLAELVRGIAGKRYDQ